MAQFSRYQFIPSAKLFTQYISRPFLFKIDGCDLVLNLLDIIGYLSGLCLSARACRVTVWLGAYLYSLRGCQHQYQRGGGENTLHASGSCGW